METESKITIRETVDKLYEREDAKVFEILRKIASKALRETVSIE